MPDQQKSLTEQQKRAIARAKADLRAEREDTAHDSAYWRGWLRQTLTTLIDDLEDGEGEQQ